MTTSEPIFTHLCILGVDCILFDEIIVSRYETYVRKFKNTFPVDPDVEVRYLPGNSDVGCVLSVWSS